MCYSLSLRLLPCQSQETDPECTIYVRDHDFFDFEEDGRFPRRGSLLNTSRSQGINAASTVAEAAVAEVLDKEMAATQAAARAAATEPQQGQGRTAVTASAEGITVVWHEGPFIWMRRFSHSCRSRSAALVVSRDPALGKGAKTADLGTGLGDAVALTEGRTATAWTVDGEVWVRVMKVGERAAPAVLASTDGRRLRREVTMTVIPDFTGFVVAWSAWGQDGDSWGIFARFFNQEGQPTDLEQQVNVGGSGSQQHPQLFACTTGARGPAVWASWLNGTLGATHEFYVRRLGLRSFNFGPEVKLDASGVLTSASLMCASGSSTQNPAVIWANGVDRKVNWRTIVEPNSRGGSLPESKVSSASLEDKNHGQFLSQRTGNHSKPGARTSAMSAAVSGNQSARSRRAYAIPASMQLRGEGDVLALASNDEHGGLTVRLFDMSPIAAYPTHQITFGGARLDRLAYDVTLDQALIICFSHRSGVTCERRHLQSLMEAEMEQVSWWFGVVILVIIFWFRHECFGENSTQGRHWSRPAERGSSLRMTGSMLNRLKARDMLSQEFNNVPRPMWKFNMRKAVGGGFNSPF